MSDESARLAFKTHFYAWEKEKLVVEVVVENNNSGPLSMCGSVTFPSALLPFSNPWEFWPLG